MLQERSNRSRVHSSELPSRRRQSPPKEKKKKSITTHERSTFFLVRSNHSLSRDKTKMNESNCWKKNRLLLRSNSRNGISPCFFFTLPTLWWVGPIRMRIRFCPWRLFTWQNIFRVIFCCSTLDVFGCSSTVSISRVS